MSLHFRRLTRQDLPMLCGWLAAAHVLQWWEEDPSPAAVEAKYGPSVDGDDPTELFVVERQGEPVAFIQRYRLADNREWVEALKVAGTPDDAAGCDYLIGSPELIGQGLGPQLIAQFVADTWDRYPDVPAIVVDVDQRNRRSWRALEKVGFERVYSGDIDSEPPDSGPVHVYLLRRPG